MTNTTLIAKIAKASRTVGALATDKTNTQQNYNYISADKILERAGAALAEAGVVIIPAVVGDEIVRHEGTNQYGKAQIRYDAAVRFAMTISDGESQYEVPWCGRGSDYAVPDKALYKAITSGHKYFLMKLLNIGVGNEDGEHDSQSDSALQATQTAPERAVTPNRVNGTAAAPKAPQRPATPATAHIDDAPPVDENGPETLFETAVPTEREAAILNKWQSPEDAIAWATRIGGSKNEYEARNAYKKVLRDQFGNVETDANRSAVWLAYMRHEGQKWQAKQQAQQPQPEVA